MDEDDNTGTEERNRGKPLSAATAALSLVQNNAYGSTDKTPWTLDGLHCPMECLLYP
nr:hypothetical protein Iba_chr14bCG0260 [Ipomoea batatas]